MDTVMCTSLFAVFVTPLRGFARGASAPYFIYVANKLSGTKCAVKDVVDPMLKQQ
jgi:hypothetical protein